MKTNRGSNRIAQNKQVSDQRDSTDIIKENDERSPEKLARDKLYYALKTIITLYPDHRHPNVAKSSLQILKTYLSNILSNPLESKYHRLRVKNKIFQDRIVKTQGALNFLKAIGFTEEDDFYVLKTIPIYLIIDAIKMLDDAIEIL